MESTLVTSDQPQAAATPNYVFDHSRQDIVIRATEVFDAQTLHNFTQGSLSSQDLVRNSLDNLTDELEGTQFALNLLHDDVDAHHSSTDALLRDLQANVGRLGDTIQTICLQLDLVVDRVQSARLGFFGALEALMNLEPETWLSVGMTIYLVAVVAYGTSVGAGWFL